jgi:hypothetical protein
VPFGWLVQRLLVIVGSLPWWRSKHYATLYMVGRCMLASMKRKSSCDNFSCSPFFFLSFTSKGMIALQGCKSSPQSFNCIEFDLFVFQFHSLTFCFFVFFYQIWSLSFWFLFILLLIFFYWILFFDLIPNHLILIFFSFSIWSSFLWLQLLLFWVIFLINYFLFQFHPLLFNFTKLSYRIWCLYFFLSYF